jgi:ATP-dependent Lon protease
LRVSSLHARLASGLAALPLFPLPGAVLFPRAVMPLHVFEPRYRRMVADALEGPRLLSVVTIVPGPVDDLGHPTIASVAGVGTILEHVELPGGRYDILLQGLARVRLRELSFVAPYRRAEATLLEPPASRVTDADRAALSSAMSTFVGLVRLREPSFEVRLPRELDAGAVADLAAHHLVLDASEKQAVLEELDPATRVRKVAELLVVQSLALRDGAQGGDTN